MLEMTKKPGSLSERFSKEAAILGYAGALSCLALAFAAHSFFKEAYITSVIVCAITVYMTFHATIPDQRTRAYFYYLGMLPLFIVMFAWIYEELGIVNGKIHSNNFLDCVYFSIITWTTVGYGDFEPTVTCRMWAATEALTGYIFMAILIALTINLLENRNKNIEQPTLKNA